jgi:hypothetical protein
LVFKLGQTLEVVVDAGIEGNNVRITLKNADTGKSIDAKLPLFTTTYPIHEVLRNDNTSLSELCKICELRDDSDFHLANLYAVANRPSVFSYICIFSGEDSDTLKTN